MLNKIKIYSILQKKDLKLPYLDLGDLVKVQEELFITLTFKLNNFRKNILAMITTDNCILKKNNLNVKKKKKKQ
jgi:hypothetical protein